MEPAVLPSDPARKSRNWWLLLVFAAVVLLRLPLLGIPFERDEGEYAYIAWRLGFHEAPYRDWVNQKPPAVFCAYRLAFALPMNPTDAIHLVAALFAAGSACAMVLIARKFLSNFWAVTAGLLLGVLSADPAAQGNAANTEVFMVLPMLLAQLLFFTALSRRTFRWMILCGALTGLAALFKQVAAMNWFALALLWPVSDREPGRWRRTFLFAALSFAGAAIVWGLVLVWFWCLHALGDFFYNVLTHNLAYVQGVPWRYRPLNFRRAFDSLLDTESMVWWLAGVGILALAWQRRLNWLLFVLITGVAGAVGVSASGYYFPHYFQQWLPPLALCAVAGASGLEQARLVSLIPYWIRRTMLVLFLVFPFAVNLYPFLFVYTPEQASYRIYPDNRFPAMADVARRLAEITSANDRVFLYAAEPEILFYARRVSATRYIILYPLFGNYADAHQRQTEAADEITRAHPTAALFYPVTLFFVPGDQYFNDWAAKYLKEAFQTDSWLVVDLVGETKVVTAQQPGDNVRAILYARKKGR
jgi:4-amino-4-deoxy-L-arabinose transferase-like glycosyltransferase